MARPQTSERHEPGTCQFASALTGALPAPKTYKAKIKVARLASQHLGLTFSDRQLVAMVTTNAGDALSRCWRKTVGRLERGAFADIVILRPRGEKSVWTQLVESTERDVMLVVCGGVPRYGDSNLMAAAGLTKSSSLTVRGKKRAFAMPDPTDPAKVWSWQDIKSRLDAVRRDPVTALSRANARRRAYAGRMDAPEAPLVLVLDMPTGTASIAGDVSRHAADIVIRPLPTLVHDVAFFKSIKGRGFHGGLLDGLAGFYS